MWKFLITPSYKVTKMKYAKRNEIKRRRQGNDLSTIIFNKGYQISNIPEGV